MTNDELKFDAIKHIKEHGNLATWGDNFTSICEMYILLQKEQIITFDCDEKIWKIVKLVVV